MNNFKKPKKPILYYYIIAMIIVILLNSFVFPSMMRGKEDQIDYGQFLEMVESGKVEVVEIKDNDIYIKTKKSDMIYKTGTMEDPDLVNRLYLSGVKFSRELSDTTPTLFSTLLTWIITIIIFVGIGQLFARSMQKEWAMM